MGINKLHVRLTSENEFYLNNNGNHFISKRRPGPVCWRGTFIGSQNCLVTPPTEFAFTLCWTALAPKTKPYRIGLPFTHTAQILKVDRHSVDNNSNLRDGRLEKLWGRGEFSSCRNFLSWSNSFNLVPRPTWGRGCKFLEWIFFRP